MFVRVELSKTFQPREDNKVYGMDRLLDMAVYPKARAITFYAVADSSVNAVLTIRVVGSDTPNPGSDIVNLGDSQVTTALKYSKVVSSINMASAPFPYYGLTFETGPTAPNVGFCWAYADIWWGE